MNKVIIIHIVIHHRRSQGSSDKEVKKLEKKLEEGNKTISQLKKTTNLDSAVKGMVSLIDQVLC